GIVTPDQDFRFYRPSRRCLPIVMSWQITDNAGGFGQGSSGLDPTTAKLFNNNTENCGLG
ncbi:MAG TPA: hypothetical protein VI547_04750, partial [Anaerolineales bacterium]|nr:hypothetical protein [Anaerolineales bacterium]